MGRVIALVVVLLAAACSSSPDEQPAPAAGPAANLAQLTDRLPAPQSRWGPCPSVPGGPSPETPGLSCADVLVPLDYADPGGRRISIKISRLSTGDGRPVLLSNPGGPGAPGLFNTLGVDRLTGGQLRGHYDLIGFDPRGVGLSTPADCPVDDATAAALTGGSAPTTFDADATTAKTLADACASTDPAALRQLTTNNTARDVEMIRKALGVDRVSFYGNSYGTELAITYASLFPAGTGRVVADGMSDMTTTAQQAQAEGAAAADARFTEIAGQLAADDRTWHLGSDAAAVRALYLDTLARLDREPVSFQGTTVDAAALQTQQLLPALQDDSGVETLALTLGFLAKVPKALSEDGLATRLDAGAPAGGGTLPDGQTLRQAVSAFYAVRCNETGWQRDRAANLLVVQQEQARWPVTRGQFSKIGPCAFWPGGPAEPRPAVTSAGWSGGPNVLILQNTRDYRAPGEGVRNVRNALGGRAVLVSVDDYHHGVLGRNPCATGWAVHWLIDGALPDEDQHC